MFLRRMRKLWGNVAGAVAIEMAFALPAFIIFMFGIIGTSHMYWVYNSMQYALDMGGRYAMLNISATDTQVANVVKANVYSIPVTSLAVTTTSVTTGPTSSRTINLVYTYSFLGSMGSFLPTTLTASTTVPIIP